MSRKVVSSGAPWESIVGYSRAVRVGNIIEVAGTTAVVDGQLVGKGDAYLQTKCILQIMESALKQADASMQDVVRTRIFVVNIEDWKEVAKAHSEFFDQVRPASTLVEVSKLVDPDMLVEIEIQAILDKEE